jgi:hypothetical protein
VLPGAQAKQPASPAPSRSFDAKLRLIPADLLDPRFSGFARQDDVDRLVERVIRARAVVDDRVEVLEG